MVSAARMTDPASGAEAGIREASDGDHGPERKTKLMFLHFSSAVKRWSTESDSSRSPVEDALRSGVGKSWYSLLAAQVRRMLGRVTRRRTVSL